MSKTVKNIGTVAAFFGELSDSPQNRYWNGLVQGAAENNINLISIP